MAGLTGFHVSATSEFESYANGESGSVDLIATIRAPPAREGERLPVSVGAVLDRSGSMAGKKMELVRATGRFMVRQLAGQDRLGVVAYDSKVTEPLPAQLMDGTGKVVAANKISALRTGDYTNLSGGLFKGVQQQQEVAVEETPGPTRCVMLFTDGLANEGVTDPEKIVTTLAQRKDVLVRLKIPKVDVADKPYPLLTVKLTFMDVGEAMVKHVEMTLVVDRPLEIPQGRKPNPEVVDQRERIEAVEAMARATREADSGNLDVALNIVKERRVALQAIPDLSMQAQDLLADLREAEGMFEDRKQYSSYGSKKVRNMAHSHTYQRSSGPASAMRYATTSQMRMVAQSRMVKVGGGGEHPGGGGEQQAGDDDDASPEGLHVSMRSLSLRRQRSGRGNVQLPQQEPQQQQVPQQQQGPQQQPDPQQQQEQQQEQQQVQQQQQQVQAGDGDAGDNGANDQTSSQRGMMGSYRI
eukprot:evm.model.scf_752.6 EVM.evm.TU.scf_752.6   scf_752:40964-48049(-)